jgi:two-component system, chemotaxis family, chemotaxis protein CheY
MATGLSALRVLVIDDNEQMREVVGTVLSAAGVEHLHYAGDGRRGLEIIATVAIDVVYVDHEMPVMNGLDFIAAVRAPDSPARYLPIIMLTGYADLSHLSAARDRGVTEFLAKPVNAKSILARLNAVIMDPRPFVQSSDFFGPDRRRKQAADYDGPLRRASDGGEASGATS